MLTQSQLESFLNTHPLITSRLQTLKLAAKINPDFATPHIQGGYLRNVALGVEPKDCDVFFAGSSLNQQGIAEAVKEAEQQLGMKYENWEFENLSATGVSGDFYADAVGTYAPYTDHISTLIMNAQGALRIGSPQTLSDLFTRTYNLRFEGIEVWVNHRAQGRSRTSCILGDLIRAIYLCHDLDLTPSPATAELLCRFDDLFNGLSLEDQQSRIRFWLKKTGGDQKYKNLLNQYNIESLPIDLVAKT